MTAMRRTVFTVLGLALVAGAVLPASASADAAKPGAMGVGDIAPDFKGISIQKEAVELGKLLAAGRTVVLSFWGARCSPCLEEMPALRKIQDEFRDRGVAVVGVNADGLDAAALGDLMKEEKIEPGYLVVADPDMRIVDVYKMTVAPLTVIIDKAGVVRFVHEDYRKGDEKAVRDAIKAILTGSPK